MRRLSFGSVNAQIFEYCRAFLLFHASYPTQFDGFSQVHFAFVDVFQPDQAQPLFQTVVLKLCDAAVRAACGSFSGPNTIKAMTPNKSNSENPISNITVTYINRLLSAAIHKRCASYFVLIISSDNRANFHIINLSACLCI